MPEKKVLLQNLDDFDGLAPPPEPKKDDEPGARERVVRRAAVSLRVWCLARRTEARRGVLPGPNGITRGARASGHPRTRRRTHSRAQTCTCVRANTTQIFSVTSVYNRHM